MNAMILLTESKSAWRADGWAEDQGGQRDRSGRVLVEHPSCWLAVTQNDSLFAEYDGIEKEYVIAEIRKPNLYLIEWRGEDLLVLFLRSIPQNINALVDNDHGLIVGIEAIRRLPIKSWIRNPKLPEPSNSKSKYPGSI